MEKKKARQRIEKLKKVINRHRYLYHVQDRQEISDEALDSLKKELFDLEQKFPDLVTPDSPTQRIGGKPLDKFKKVKHETPMLSFNDAFSKEDIEDWLKRAKDLLTEKEKKEIDFYCELKIDGLAIELVFEDYLLKTGSTRGDGKTGEDITQNLKTIEAIPLKLRDREKVLKSPKVKKIKEFKSSLTIRGEVFISKKEFERINKERETPYANPRNLAAGSVRQLDPSVAAKRNLDSFAYDLVTDFGQKTHEEKHQILKVLGFKTNPNNRYCKNLDEVFEFHKKWQKRRDSLPYEIDGIVVIINSDRIYNKLGVVGKAPRGAIAFKFPGKEATTKVRDIKVQVGRTGALTPVAVLEPVQVGGVTITRATLHNEDEIRRLGVKIGDTVIVGRAGDVIPEIVKVVKDLRTGKEKKFKMPSKCPLCGGKVKKIDAIHYCANPNCFARERQQFYHFVSRGAFNIEGLGPKIIGQLMEESLVSDLGDIFELKRGDLKPLERFAEKSADNLVKSIEESKEITFPRFIFALGIKHIGEETAQDLAKHFSSLENLKKASKKDLEDIEDIGPKAAQSIKDWFSDKKNKELLKKFKRVGIKIEKVKRGTKLKGKKFVLTGSLNSLTREEAKKKIRSLGGEVSSSVSREIDYLVIGEDPGSKYQKAKKLKVNILKEKEFLKML